MIWIYSFTVLCAILSIACFTGLSFIDSYRQSGLELFLIIAGFAMVIGTLVFGIMSFAIPLSYHYDARSCKIFAAASGRETKMIRYNAFEWDCLTPNKSGKWIPTSGLRQFGEE